MVKKEGKQSVLRVKKKDMKYGVDLDMKISHFGR